MNATEYQQLAARTLIDRPGFDLDDTSMMILWNALGLAGEAGEVAETVKKGILHQHGLDRDKMAKELGDCLWYIAALCTKLELDMGQVMDANIEKLKVRYPDGFKSTDSVARVDVEPLDWAKAEQYLATCERIYGETPNGILALSMTIMPLRHRFDRGERTEWLYNDIMEVEL